MTDTYLMPNKQLAAAMLSPVRAVLSFGLLFSVLLLAFWGACLFQYFGAWERSTGPLGALYLQALDQVSPGHPLAHMAGWAEFLTRRGHELIFVATGVEDMGRLPEGGPTPFGAAASSVVGQLTPSLQVLVLATQVFGVRMAILAGMLPLVMLCYLVASIDGLAERAVRRACAGRESAQRYHSAKSLQYGCLGLVLITMLCLPVQAPPPLVTLIFAGAVTLLARAQWAYYKKYA